MPKDDLKYDSVCPKIDLDRNTVHRQLKDGSLVKSQHGPATVIMRSHAVRSFFRFANFLR